MDGSDLFCMVGEYILYVMLAEFLIYRRYKVKHILIQPPAEDTA